jgi:hypothetical protein
MMRRIERLLERHGPLTFAELRRRLGRDARGPHNMDIVGPMVKFRGLSQLFGDSLYILVRGGSVWIEDHKPYRIRLREPR